MSDRELLGLTKPEEPSITRERERRTEASAEARLLASVGERICPDGLTYVASFASHIYHNALRGEYVYFSQSTDVSRLPEFIANDAVKEQARALALKYGHKPPRKVGETGEL